MNWLQSSSGGDYEGGITKILPGRDITQRIESDCASEFHFPRYFGKLNGVNETRYAYIDIYIYISFRDQRSVRRA